MFKKTLKNVSAIFHASSSLNFSHLHIHQKMYHHVNLKLYIFILFLLFISELIDYSKYLMNFGFAFSPLQFSLLVFLLVGHWTQKTDKFSIHFNQPWDVQQFTFWKLADTFTIPMDCNRFHRYHRIVLVKSAKTTNITQDQSDLEPYTNPMPADGKVGIESVWYR